MHLIFISAILLSCVQLANAQDDYWRDGQFTVGVSADCKDQLVRDSLVSYINRELREYSDVRIVGSGFARDFDMAILAMPIQNSNGDPAIAVSVVITEQFPVFAFHDMLDRFAEYIPVYKKSSLQNEAEAFFGGYRIKDHNMIIGKREGINDIAHAIVLSFDLNQLEKARQFKQQSRNILTELNEINRRPDIMKESNELKK